MYSWRGGRSWCTVREGGWSWCTAGEGGVELVYCKYSYRGRGGAGVQLEREGRSWCTVREGGAELVYSN